MEAPVSSVIPLITAPPLPITSLILSGSILKDVIVGAHSDISVLDESITLFISPRICNLASLACLSAISIISFVIPWIFISI